MAVHGSPKGSSEYTTNTPEVMFEDILRSIISDAKSNLAVRIRDFGRDTSGATEHVWRDEILKPISTTLTNVGGVNDSATVFTVASTAGFFPGLQFQAAGSFETIMVITVDSSTQLTVERGFGNTSALAAAIAENAELTTLVTSLDALERGEDFNSENGEERTAHWLKLQKQIAVTEFNQLTKNRFAQGGPGEAIENELRQVLVKIERELSRGMLYAGGQKISKTSRGSWTGLITRVVLQDPDPGGLQSSVKDLSGAPFTLSDFNDATEILDERGGFQDGHQTVLYIHPKKVDALTATLTQNQRLMESTDRIGATVEALQSKQGFLVPIVRTRHIQESHAFLVDESRAGWVTLMDSQNSEETENQTVVAERVVMYKTIKHYNAAETSQVIKGIA